MTFKNISGVGKLMRKFKAAPAIHKEIVTKTMEKAGAEMARTARALAPVKTGTLRDSIHHFVGPDSEGSGLAVFIIAGVDSERDAFGKFINPDPEGGKRAFYARFVEFGTLDGVSGAQPPQPFFFPAFRLMRRQMKRRLKSASKRSARRIANA